MQISNRFVVYCMCSTVAYYRPDNRLMNVSMIQFILLTPVLTVAYLEMLKGYVKFKKLEKKFCYVFAITQLII